MEAYVLDWLNLLVRWLHLITGIAWIGASFYFVMLDNSLSPPAKAEDAKRGVLGELWLLQADRHTRADAALPGEIVVLPGELGLCTGDTVCDPAHAVVVPMPSFPMPVLAVTFEPAHADDGPKLAAALREPFSLNELSVDVGGSIGIACYPEHGQNIESLIQHADVAMYKAKHTRAGFVVYTPEGGRSHADPLVRAADAQR